MCQCGADYPASTTFGQVHFLREHFVVTTYFRIPDLFTPFLILFNSSLLWDVFIINSVEQLHRLEEGFCVFKNGLISISDWVFGNVWSCSTLFIMKASHKNDELIKRGSTNRVPMRIPYRLKMCGILYFVLTTCSMGHNYHMYLYLIFPIKQNDHVYEK